MRWPCSIAARTSSCRAARQRCCSRVEQHTDNETESTAMADTKGTSPLAGKPATESMLVDVPRLITAYFALRPDPAQAVQRVAFGTSGHRGSSFDATFNEWHVAAITQASCEYRIENGIRGALLPCPQTHGMFTPSGRCAI